MSKNLEWYTGTMKIPSERAWAMALDKQQLLAENDFGKLSAFRHHKKKKNQEMGVEESAALNEEEIMFWLTLKRANTTSILTAVMVPHVVAAWLDEEERDAM